MKSMRKTRAILAAVAALTGALGLDPVRLTETRGDVGRVNPDLWGTFRFQ